MYTVVYDILYQLPMYTKVIYHVFTLEGDCGLPEI